MVNTLTQYITQDVEDNPCGKYYLKDSSDRQTKMKFKSRIYWAYHTEQDQHHTTSPAYSIGFQTKKSWDCRTLVALLRDTPPTAYEPSALVVVIVPSPASGWHLLLMLAQLTKVNTHK
jgi:hypothetical protein